MKGVIEAYWNSTALQKSKCIAAALISTFHAILINNNLLTVGAVMKFQPLSMLVSQPHVGL
jgi:hypothetical protein